MPEPIRKSTLPPTPPSEWEVTTVGGKTGAVIRRQVSYGKWEPVLPDYWADEPATVRNAARTASGQQPETGPCACTHPQDRHLSACTECPCIGYAPTWPPTKRRIVPVCDQCGAPWATSHRCATAPAVGQPAEAQATDRAAVLREAARAVFGRVEAYEGMDDIAFRLNRERSAIADLLRRMAEEARS
ncbi:hypothetical protein [Streptomyces lateritius]|uniref:hypothetical protein n=1 Tax=Streptomyces lateritius TaxID=67313 RepID=UPI001C8BA9A2|nr:hypothetical protein [Streptomyces lateritius]MBX9425471.1 hypothetical protein [Streptomyces lateritius]